MSAQFQDDDEKKEEKDSYSFLKETIKKPPVDKRVVALKILRVAGLGLIFGLMACVGFVVAKPWVDEHIGNTRTNVTIPQDEQTEEEDETESEVAEAHSLIYSQCRYFLSFPPHHVQTLFGKESFLYYESRGRIHRPRMRPFRLFLFPDESDSLLRKTVQEYSPSLTPHQKNHPLYYPPVFFPMHITSYSIRETG